MDIAEDNENRSGTERTARIALLTGAPGLGLTVLAAFNADSLALHADLILTVLDVLVLATVWAVALRGCRSLRSSDRNALRRAEHLACTLAAACMLLSMGVVVWIAIGRIAYGGLAPSGAGVAIGMGLNAAYAVVNLWILRRWRIRYRLAPSAFARSQVCLFWDKLSTNLIVSGSLAMGLAFPHAPLGAYVDPIAGLLIAAATARWVSPVLRDAARAAWIGWARRRRRVARAGAGLQAIKT
jgi:divalent metal cation (Fe/Co/Zn/Cd) transporter